MKYIKRYKIFKEDATENASTSGMGSVFNAQPGSISGIPDTIGSGDIDFYFKKEKRKKGNPSQVTDLRDLKDVKINKIKESIEFTDDEIIKESLIDLIDDGFVIQNITHNTNWHDFINECYVIELRGYKKSKFVFREDVNINYNFDKNDITKNEVNIYKNGNRKERVLNDHEIYLTEMCDESAHQLINQLEFERGFFKINYVEGTTIIQIGFYLYRKHQKQLESYNNIDEYRSEIIDQFKMYNIRPLVLNHLLDVYSDNIENNYENDKQPKDFVDEIVKDMELDSGGFMSQQMGSDGYNRTIKYL